MSVQSDQQILLLNAGSSSLKCTLMEADRGTVVAQGMADWAGETTRYQYASLDGKKQAEDVSWRGYAAAVRRMAHDLIHADPIALPHRHALAAVGHRIVHGGQFTTSVRIAPEIRERLAALADLAPLHNPPSLEALAAAQEQFPDAPHVAVFDTAFHSTLSAFAHTYPIPASWTQDWSIRRFGFHGLSHAYCSKRAAEMLRLPADKLRLVICHLGHGCSASAVLGGKCVDTTMGFTPLDGLMMATRSGSIDPGIILHVQQRRGLTPAETETALNRESGLLGVSGISGDMPLVLAAAMEGHEPARLALDIYTHRVRQAIGALTVTMGGIDALVFTAGVGEHATDIRA